MDLQRFTVLSETYGGCISRWPQAERTAAYALAETDVRAASVLGDGDALDALLDDWCVEPASAALRVAVVASVASMARPSLRLWPWARDIRLWFAGAGLAAALAGVFCGALLSTAAVGEARDEALVASAVSDTAVSVPGPVLAAPSPQT